MKASVKLRWRPSSEAPLFSALPGEGSDGVGNVVVDAGGDVRFYRNWLSRARADVLLAHIRATTTWQQERRKMYDRFVDVPREQAWCGDDRERPWSAPLDAVRRELEIFAAARFSYVLLNRYRDGKDSVAWHSDREVLGLRNPVIASLTLGATRAFDLRRKTERERVISLDLEHGDLLIMRGDTQSHWEHRVRKDTRILDERVNLTFRQQPA